MLFHVVSITPIVRRDAIAVHLSVAYDLCSLLFRLRGRIFNQVFVDQTNAFLVAGRSSLILASLRSFFFAGQLRCSLVRHAYVVLLSIVFSGNSPSAHSHQYCMSRRFSVWQFTVVPLLHPSHYVSNINPRCSFLRLSHFWPVPSTSFNCHFIGTASHSFRNVTSLDIVLARAPGFVYHTLLRSCFSQTVGLHPPIRT